MPADRGSASENGGVRIGPEVVGTLLLVAVVVASGLFAVGTGSVTAQPQSGEPRLDAFAPGPALAPGETTELTVQISNDGRVSSGTSPETQTLLTTARNVRVEVLDDDTPIEVETGQQSIGTMTTDEPREVPIRVTVPGDTEPGEYELDVELRYRHAAQINQGRVTNDRSRTVTRTITVEVDDGPRFALRDARTDAQVGDAGSMTVELQNVGGEAATDVIANLESTSARVAFGESPSESAGVDRLEPGETATLEYAIAFDRQASRRGYPLDATISYRDADGVAGVDERPSVDVTPQARQTFAIDDIDSTLRVGEDGDLRGTVTNTGSATARSVVVQFAHESPNVVPIEREVAVGTLDPDESAPFRLPIEIGREAEAVPKSFDLAVQYRNADDERRIYEDVEATVDIAERRDEFLLSVRDREIQAGDSIRFEIEATNNLDRTVTDVEAKLFTSDPLDSEDDEGYIESLEPGESTRITFELNAESTATAKTYPVSIDFRYDDERGTSEVSDTYRVAIDVTEADDEGISWLPVGGAAVLLVAGGVALFWRRSG